MRMRGGLILESIAPQEWRVVRGDRIAYLRLDRLTVRGARRREQRYAWSVVRDSRVTHSGLRWCLSDALDDIAYVLLAGARSRADRRAAREAV